MLLFAINREEIHNPTKMNIQLLKILFTNGLPNIECVMFLIFKTISK